MLHNIVDEPHFNDLVATEDYYPAGKFVTSQIQYVMIHFLFYKYQVSIFRCIKIFPQ